MPEQLNIFDARLALKRRKETENSVPSSSEPATPARELLVPNNEPHILSLLETTPAPLPLNAYLASALTGLTEDQRRIVFGISDLISDVCEKNGISLYQPRKKTDPVLHAEVSPSEVYAWDKQTVLNSDLLIHLCHHPSTGAGEELEFAHAALLPILLVYPADLKVSRMVLGIPSLVIHVAYNNVEDLHTQLSDILFNFRPLLEERKLALARYDVNIVGEKVRELRERLGLTRSEFANSSKYVTEKILKNIEEKTDRDSNPSLIQLREIATVLKTTVSELIEPDFNQRVLVMLNAWVSDRAAARNTISKNDRTKAVKAILRRLADQMDDD
jgi:transcriptional regulator with XRE-family HTH domain